MIKNIEEINNLKIEINKITSILEFLVEKKLIIILFNIL